MSAGQPLLPDQVPCQLVWVEQGLGVRIKDGGGHQTAEARENAKSLPVTLANVAPPRDLRTLLPEAPYRG